jgi:hypothetical protein
VIEDVFVLRAPRRVDYHIQDARRLRKEEFDRIFVSLPFTLTTVSERGLANVFAREQWEQCTIQNANANAKPMQSAACTMQSARTK